MPRGRKTFGDVKAVEALRKELERQPTPRMAEVATEFIRLAGGTKQFATLIWKQYIDPESTPAIKHKIITSVLSCIKTDGDQYTPDSLSDISDEDLHALLPDLLNKSGILKMDGDGDAEPANEPATGPAAAESAEEFTHTEAGHSPAEEEAQQTGEVPEAES